jgi:hypothetical protein
MNTLALDSTTLKHIDSLQSQYEYQIRNHK